MPKMRFFVILLAVVLFGCQGQKEIGEGEKSFQEADKSNLSDVKIPEGLARATSTIYRELIEKKRSTFDVYPELLDYSSEVSREQMKNMQNQFADSIEVTRDFFSARDLHIKEFVFSEAAYTDDSAASVYRIQVMNDGKLYYFKQDFILEKDAWKIKGDNICDPFKIVYKKN